MTVAPSPNFRYLAHHDPKRVAVATRAEILFATDPAAPNAIALLVGVGAGLAWRAGVGHGGLTPRPSGLVAPAGDDEDIAPQPFDPHGGPAPARSSLGCDGHDLAHNPPRLLPTIAALALLTSAWSDESTVEGAGGGDASGTGGGGGATGSTGAGILTTECGTYDTSLPGDLVIPDDPSDSGIVAACADYCMRVEQSCLGTEERCNDACRATACDVCPGTWDPYVICLAEAFAPDDACSCDEDMPACGAPPCSGERDATTQCGG